MNRRDFAKLTGAAAMLPAAAWAEAMPVIGFLHSGVAEQNVRRVAALRRGLSAAGFVEGGNVAIEFRWGGGQNAKLAEMASELIARKVAVIATLSSTPAAVVAKKATDSVPIYFLIADPPVELGLVASLNRPGGNATGLVTLAVELVPKRLELLRQIAPKAAALAFLVNPSHPSAPGVTAAYLNATTSLGVPSQVLQAASDAEIEAAYAALKPGSALLVGTDPTFFARRAKFIALSARHAVPTMFDSVETANDGGLMSYGADIESLWTRAGTNIARILKGAKPADLPVEQASKFLFAVNIKTAKALGLEIPNQLRVTADEVIE
jgi:putative tryptophan/tyrosine transport system substrate-binding protein